MGNCCGCRKRRAKPNPVKSRTSNSPLDPHRPIAECTYELKNATYQVREALTYHREQRKTCDIQRSIEKFERALRFCSLDHPCRAAAKSNVALAEVILFKVNNSCVSLDIPFALYYHLLTTYPAGHPDRPSTLVHLAILHLVRFERLQDKVDEARAEEMLHLAVELSTVDCHETWAASTILRLQAERKAANRIKSASDLWESSVQLLQRYERLGSLDNLQQAISILEGMMKSSSSGDSWYPSMLQNFSFALSERFEHLGNLADLERAISMRRDAVKLIPDSSPDKSYMLNRLGNSLLTRFERLGELGDLECAISSLGDAVELTPGRNPLKADRLNDFGASLSVRFERLGQLDDLNRAILMKKDALELVPEGHPYKPSLLGSLGMSFIARYERLGDLGDLSRAISSQMDAVQLMPDGDPFEATQLNNLGNSFLTRYDRFGELDDLQQAISRLMNANELTPENHPDKHTRLGNLGNCFLTRFERLGNLVDLEMGISKVGEAVELIPDGHPNKPNLLANLSHFYLTRFCRLGEFADLDRAISRAIDSVRLIPNDHPRKPRLLVSLANSLDARFECRGDLGDIELAILRYKEAIELLPDCHPEKPGLLYSLAYSLRKRFQHLGDPIDIERAISMVREANELTPDGPLKSLILNELGNSSLCRFEHLGELSDLECAISCIGDAIRLMPDGHTLKPGWLNNLGNSFRARFQRHGELADLEKAIAKFEEAVQLTPDGHPKKPSWQNNLGKILEIRFTQLGDLGDIERAISVQWDAVRLTPDDRPEKTAMLSSLVVSLFARFERLKDPTDLEQVILLSSRSASHTTGPITARFNASRIWISCARIYGHPTLFQAYSTAIDILPQLAWIGLSLDHRCRKLVQGADIVREAAAMAVELGYLETAVEWLEQGRSVIWGELFQLRSSHDELFAKYPDHARKLRQLSTQLEQACATQEEPLLFDATQKGITVEPVANKHRMLAIERDKLLKEIRDLPGFERFLLRKQSSQLRSSAHLGPVVILNADKSRCDALIVLADVDDIIHVPLPNFPLAHTETLQAMMTGLTREGKWPRHEFSSPWEPILSSLWKCVVKPVLDSLALLNPGKQSRIFWCPTGPLTFLPIHAAGLFDTEHSQPGYKVFDYVVSSYTPTLGILMPSSVPHPETCGDVRFLVVGQPPSDGLFRLPGVEAELKHVRDIIEKSPSARTTLRESSSGTVDEVLELMKEADWVHFACHGIQDASNPTDSGLCLADGRRLKLSDIIALSRPRGGLAFLSACQTATGDRKLSDEAIHIAAGMLFVGYAGVIGTMWSIRDRLAPEVAKDVYERLFSSGTVPDHRDAARALQSAVGRLRDGGASFSEWIPFIHVGL